MLGVSVNWAAVPQILALAWLLAHSHIAQATLLNPAEQAYLQQHGPISFCVDPDWPPFEVVDAQGQHRGIGADLLALVAARAGVAIKLLPTKDWPESLEASKAGRCQLLSLLNQTPERDAWLIFTQPVLADENIIITREEHAFVADLTGLQNHTLVLPKGTSIEERVRRDYPNIHITITDSEAQALAMVSERQADLTVRSLIVAAYTIKRQGWFNLKIAGQVPGYGNQLRIGVAKGEPLLRDILDKGVASITPVERQQIIDRHIPITATTGLDYGPIKQLLGVFALMALTSLFWLRKINRAKKLAEQTATLQRQFIAMLSHEVRTPLAVIDATAQLLTQRLQDAPELAVLVGRIQRGSVRLANFFNNCLTTDRIDSHHFTVHSAPIELQQLVTWVTENATMLSPGHHITLDIAPNLPTLYGDQSLLRILLMNLLDNALKYAPPNTSVLLRVARKAGDPAQCCFTVQDQGPGIAADEIDTIFHKYQRGRSGEGKPGAGLGLTVVSRIARLHGGSVSVQSQPDQGASFTVQIPFGTQK